MRISLLLCLPLFANAQLVDRPVRGLYESIPPARVFRLARHDVIACAEELVGASRVTVRLIARDRNEESALADRGFNADRTAMRLHLLMRRDGRGLAQAMPSFVNVPGVIPLVPGRGLPTSLFLNLASMRIAGVPYQALRVVGGRSVDNPKTLLQIETSNRISAWMRMSPGLAIPESLIEDCFWTTNTGLYVKTFLTQAGVRVWRLKVFDVKMKGNLLQSFSFDAELEPRSDGFRF